jgi:hypothetical protein
MRLFFLLFMGCALAVLAVDPFCELPTAVVSDESTLGIAVQCATFTGSLVVDWRGFGTPPLAEQTWTTVCIHGNLVKRAREKEKKKGDMTSFSCRSAPRSFFFSDCCSQHTGAAGKKKNKQ